MNLFNFFFPEKIVYAEDNFSVVYSSYYDIYLGDHIFPGNKFSKIYELICLDEHFSKITFHEPDKVSREQLELVHTKEYLDDLFGLEIKKSDLCKFSRESLGKLLHIMFEGGLEDLPNKQNMLDYIREQKLEFVKQGVNEIGCAKGLKDFENWDVKNFKDFKPKTPIYYRAGVLYNYIVDELNLPYQKCQNGTKINYVYVNTKNKYKTDVIGYIGNWPKEFDSMFQIDYELQFEKQYLDLSQRIFDTLGFGEIIIKKSKLMSLIEDD
jgi:hypothetical protein